MSGYLLRSRHEGETVFISILSSLPLCRSERDSDLTIRNLMWLFCLRDPRFLVTHLSLFLFSSLVSCPLLSRSKISKKDGYITLWINWYSSINRSVVKQNRFHGLVVTFFRVLRSLCLFHRRILVKLDKKKKGQFNNILLRGLVQSSINENSGTFTSFVSL